MLMSRAETEVNKKHQRQEKTISDFFFKRTLFTVSQGQLKTLIKVCVQSGFLSHGHMLTSVVATDRWHCQSSVARAHSRQL